MDSDMLIDETAMPRRSASVSSIDIDGDRLLLEPVTNRIHQLDRLGSLVWSVLDGDATLGELVDDFADAFSTPRDVVEEDLTRLVSELARYGLLDGTVPPAPLATEAERETDHDTTWRPRYLIDPPAP